MTCNGGESSHTAIVRKVGFVKCDARKRHVHGTDSIWNRTSEQELQECGRGLRFSGTERSNNFSGAVSGSRMRPGGTQQRIAHGHEKCTHTSHCDVVHR